MLRGQNLNPDKHSVRCAAASVGRDGENEADDPDKGRRPTPRAAATVDAHPVVHEVSRDTARTVGPEQRNREATPHGGWTLQHRQHVSALLCVTQTKRKQNGTRNNNKPHEHMGRRSTDASHIARTKLNTIASFTVSPL